jgi:hypothetical protein
MPKKKNKIQKEKRMHSGQDGDAYLFSIFTFKSAKIISFFKIKNSLDIIQKKITFKVHLCKKLI